MKESGWVQVKEDRKELSVGLGSVTFFRIQDPESHSHALNKFEQGINLLVLTKSS